ncbi:MAG TPA: TonB-dependent receptor [Caulobacteraceae bacterium]|jgi:outer membrane receptor protein involved in Fe transport|nr:TonB-dependent receptor [Caulobacteraceae bacterium]
MTRLAMLYGMVAVGALLQANPALSAPQKANFDTQQEFRIPSQPLETALLLYSRQSGLQIISASPVVANKIAPALRGTETPRKALEDLLKGSNLSFVVSGSTITIIPAPATRREALVPAALQTNVSADSSSSVAAVSSSASSASVASSNPVEPVATSRVSTAAPAGQADVVQEVTVTGSRIIRNGNDAPTPVTVATVADLLETTPTTLADALNKLPQFSVQFTTQSNTGAGAPAGNFLNLRGLGQGRTLVMMDGVRVPGTSATGTVDINTLPQALVQRVEIVTGGASAVYGSDAVGGVVNYILNTKFNGFKGSVQGGISTYGDAPSGKISLAFGTRLSDKGHFEASYEHNQSAGLDQSQRSYTSATPGYAGLGTAANPFVLYNNLRMSTTTGGGFIATAAGATPAQTTALTNALVNKQFVGAGTLAPFQAGALTGSLPSAANTGGLQVGGDGAYVTGMQLLKPVDTDNLFGRFDYDVGHGVTAYAQLAYGRSATNYYVPPTLLSTTVYSGNPYLPADAQAALTAASAPGRPASIVLSTLPQNLINMQRTNQWATDVSATFGLKGKVLDDAFNWNASYTHGKGHTHVETDNNINTSHFYAALDAVRDSSGNIVCAVSLTSSASLYPGCAPLNLLGVGNESPASLAYIMQNTAYDIINKTDDLSASISGSAFHDWAGPVSVSLNFDYRWANMTQTSDAAPAAPQLTGLRQTWGGGGRGGATPSTLFLNNTFAPQYGANSVWEVGGETVVPLLKDLPLAKNLEFNGAARYTEYSSSGPATTWKVGLIYQPIDDLRFRVTDSRDIRAPNLTELYQAPTVTTVAITDPLLNNATYTVNQVAHGDPTVKPEVAKSFTLGLVYSPSWLPRFSISADYYLITINGVISNILPIGGGVNLAINTCITSGGTSIYCQAVPRPNGLSTSPTNQIIQVNQIPVNLAEQYTRGMDIEMDYGFDMADINSKLDGHTDLRTIITYEPRNVTYTNPGALGTNAAGGGTARGRISFSANYTRGPFKVSWQTNYTGPHKAGAVGLTPIYFAQMYISPVVTHDLSLSYKFKTHQQNLQAFLTVNNVFNEQPALGPPAPTTTPGAQTPLGPGAISPLGRYFTAGLRIGL